MLKLWKCACAQSDPSSKWKRNQLTDTHTQPETKWEKLKRSFWDCRVPFHNLYVFVDRFVISYCEWSICYLCKCLEPLYARAGDEIDERRETGRQLCKGEKLKTETKSQTVNTVWLVWNVTWIRIRQKSLVFSVDEQPKLYTNIISRMYRINFNCIIYAWWTKCHIYVFNVCVSVCVWVVLVNNIHIFLSRISESIWSHKIYEFH